MCFARSHSSYVTLTHGAFGAHVCECAIRDLGMCMIVWSARAFLLPDEENPGVRPPRRPALILTRHCMLCVYVYVYVYIYIYTHIHVYIYIYIIAYRSDCCPSGYSVSYACT